MSKKFNRTNLLFAFVLPCWMISLCPGFAECEQVETLRYLRPSGDDFRLETTIKIENKNDGRSIASATQRGKSTLIVSSKYGDNDVLKEANVMLASDGQPSAAVVRQINGKAIVVRADEKMTILDCPSGVIVTSAPDWTDAIMLMRRYDTRRGGEQEFAGLWIHPTREPLRLTLLVQPLGNDNVTLASKQHRLDRFQITLRNNSRYIAWRDGRHRLIRLVPGGKTQPAIVLAGWEKATADLKPRER